MNKNTEKQDPKDIKDQKEKKPNETGGFYFSSFLKISDPNSKEILVQTRGDT